MKNPRSHRIASSKIQRVRLRLPGRSYDIQIGQDAIQRMKPWLQSFKSKRAFLISDSGLKSARARVIESLEKIGWEVNELAVEAGEGLKDIESIYPLYGQLLAKKADRSSVIFALGGGSIGDAAGFIAATYMRGVSWVGLPTTLLAQVDSSVGGKTGINHESGKNLIGAFHQPSLVVCDTRFLETLSPREIVSGFGEVVKYGIAFDPVFYRYLEKNADQFFKLKSEVLAFSIRRSLQWKCKVVAKDELDLKGVREALNFGHTFGHALESATQYQTYQHGEAVIHGMRFALALSQVRGHLAAKKRALLDEFLAQLKVPPIPHSLGADQILPLMKKDKKSEKGRVRFVLLKDLGKTISDHLVSERDLEKAYAIAFLGASK